MRPRFPGMDPWLEDPGLWPGVRNRLITAIADELVPEVAPRYFVGVEQHTYVTSVAGDLGIIRPDIFVGRSRSRRQLPKPEPSTPAAAGIIEMDIEMPVEIPIEEWYLEIRTAGSGRLVTVIEILSPTNKSPGRGRREYLRKRKSILKTRTSLVEIDLLRDGARMPFNGEQAIESPYRIIISRGASRPRAKLLGIGIRSAIPPIPIPLLPKDPEPSLDLNSVLHALYDRARFDLRLDYNKPPVPPLSEEDAAWARGIVEAREKAPSGSV